MKEKLTEIETIAVKKSNGLKKFWKRFLKDTRGFTGIEAAIVLIAFIVVAAAFSFVVLRMGFIASERTQTAISETLSATTLTLTPVGAVYGIANGTVTTAIYYIEFYIRMSLRAVGGIDSANVTIIYYNDRGMQSVSTYIRPYTGDGDTIIEWGDIFKVSLGPFSGNALLRKTDRFWIELMPMRGAPITVSGIVPESIEKVTQLV